MAIESDLIPEVLPLPHPKRLTHPENEIIFLLRSTVGFAEIDETTGEVTFGMSDLERLDKASPTQLATQLILAQKRLDQEAETASGKHEEAVIKSIGAVINAVLELYSPASATPSEPPKKPKGPNNPYTMRPADDAVLSYHPGAMKSRSSHHR